MSYDVEAKVGGKLAQLGSRIIDGFARKMADQFFQRFQETVEGGGEAVEDEAEGIEQKEGLAESVAQRTDAPDRDSIQGGLHDRLYQ